MDIVGLLYGFGIVQGMVLAGILLFAPSGHRVANRFMAGLVIAIALSLLQSWLIRIGFYVRHPTGWLLIPALSFSWGPLLYLYAYSLSTRSVSWHQIAHFIPTLLLFLANYTAFWGYSTEEQQSFLRYFWSSRADASLRQQVMEIVPIFWRVWLDFHLQGNLFALQFGTYCFLVLGQIRQHNRSLKQHFSSLEHMNLRWLQTLTLICLLFLVLFLIFNRSQVMLAGYFDVDALAPSAPFIFLVFLVYFIGTAAIFQSSLIRGEEVVDNIENPKIAVDDKSTKYRRSGLSSEDAEKYKTLIMRKMQDEKFYLECDLTLPDFAKHTGLTPHQISQVINEQMEQSFFNFVSNYRIELAKQLMIDPKTRNMPIVDLAVEVGFKSKSSFYNAFKKATGMTPTQFKKT